MNVYELRINDWEDKPQIQRLRRIACHPNRGSKLWPPGSYLTNSHPQNFASSFDQTTIRAVCFPLCTNFSLAYYSSKRSQFDIFFWYANLLDTLRVVTQRFRLRDNRARRRLDFSPSSLLPRKIIGGKVFRRVRHIVLRGKNYKIHHKFWAYFRKR